MTPRPEDAAKTQAAKTATDRLAQSDSIITVRRARGGGNFVGDVTQHAPLYQQALDEHALERDLLPLGRHVWRQPRYAGLIDAHDVLILPDKWEFPWPSSWDLAFNAVTASSSIQALAEDQLRFVLSDRWQQPDGHIPCTEWVMDYECPPIFAWAAWRVYEQSHDLEFLQSVYPGLQRNYDYWWSHNMVGGSLFTGGFLGMDNLPRGDSGAPRPTRAAGWHSSRATWRASLQSCAIRPAPNATGSIAARSRRRSTRTCGTSRPASTTTSIRTARSSRRSRTAGLSR